MNEPRVIRDGKVAVLVSGWYGAGWSSWGMGDVPVGELLFDPGLVELVEKRDLLRAEHKDEVAWEAARRAIIKYAEVRWPKIYTGGLNDGLGIEWVPVGRRFHIHEYDGAESLILDDQDDWVTT